MIDYIVIVIVLRKENTFNKFYYLRVFKEFNNYKKFILKLL